jgi:uroporphyrinogen decarboxylase
MSNPQRNGSTVTPRQRVLTALRHRQPDRLPVDFLATPEIWRRLQDQLGVRSQPLRDEDFFDPAWESILQRFAVDCRVISYDQFCRPPQQALLPGARIDWWNALSRSTPNRMWRQELPDGTARDIWGHVIRIVNNPSGAYEEYATWPLAAAGSVDDLKQHPWPDPDWWDFTPLRGLLAQYDAQEEYHLRFRIGSVFEIAWQLRGMQEFLMDMVYFYDDVATQQNLMISARMWRRVIKPLHQRIIDVAKAYGKPVMYHCDGALYPLIPELIEMGVDLLNPVQADAAGMDPQRLKDEFGDRLSFHGGIDIIKTLPRGSVDDVKAEVAERMRVLGRNGGYILASSHHIQSDTPLANVSAMYDLAGRTQSTAETENTNG